MIGFQSAAADEQLQWVKAVVETSISNVARRKARVSTRRGQSFPDPDHWAPECVFVPKYGSDRPQVLSLCASKLPSHLQDDAPPPFSRRERDVVIPLSPTAGGSWSMVSRIWCD